MRLAQGHGTREYIGVLRLLETHPLRELTTAVEKALRRRISTQEGLEQLLPGLCTADDLPLDGSQAPAFGTIGEAPVSAYVGHLGKRGVT